ncbi:hypothetical protein JCM6882_007407 [Rhodosporidiobolus microsporus]
MPAPKLKGARKATRYRAREAEPEKAFDASQSRLRGREARMQTYEDVMQLGGDEDHFHLNRDKMLLEDDGGRGYGDDDDSLDDPDEIYALDLPTSKRSPSPEAEPAPAKGRKERKPRKEYKRPEKEDLKTKGRFGHTYDPEQDVVYPSSDDEEEDGEGESGSDAEENAEDAGQLQSTLLDDDAASASGSGDEESSFAGDDRWAAAQYHATRNAPGEADSDDEEAAEMELEEARRLQKRARERLSGGDFGLGDEDDEEAEGEGERERSGRLEVEEKEAKEEKKSDALLPPSAAASLSEPEAIAHLLRTSPETLALVDDFVLTAGKVKQVEADLEVVRKGDGEGGEHPALAVMELEHQALTTYLPLLAFYFSLLLTPLPARQPSHDTVVDAVLTRLSSLRQSLATMEELELTSASYGAEEGSEDEEEEEEEGVPRAKGKRRDMLAYEALDFAASLEGEDGDSDLDLDDEDDEEGEEITDSMLAGLDDGEVEALVGSLKPGDGAEELMRLVRGRQREKGLPVGRGGSDEEDEDEEDEEMSDFEEEEPVEKKRKENKPKGIVVPALAPAATKPSKAYSKSSRAASTSAAASDYLDPLALSSTDKADKSSARHSLRFHVSQVAQKAAKREQRTKQGLEGDEDAPRRSKEQARRAVLQRQEHGAAKAGKEGSALDGGEFGEEDRRAARAVRGEEYEGEGGGEGGDDDDYYDLVSAEKAEGRKAKKVKYDDARAAEKAEILALSESAVDGPRQASRQILANKGLTPKRKKENRNARVKKRLRYDKAQKKLGSMQAQYGGGEARTGYAGEAGGITKRNVKSRKLG